MAIRTGYALPFGKIDGGSTGGLSSAFSGQVPFILDIGGKIGPNVFLGAYVGLGLGGTRGQVRSACDSDGATCVTASFRTGLELLYYFLPDRSMNPWLGYGIGYEGTGAGISVPGHPEIVFAARGIEFGHFMGGLDFRLGKTFGLGPFVDFSMGEYLNAHLDLGNGATEDGSISSTAMHEWLTLGVRGVFFP